MTAPWKHRSRGKDDATVVRLDDYRPAPEPPPPPALTPEQVTSARSALARIEADYKAQGDTHAEALAHVFRRALRDPLLTTEDSP